MPKNFRQIPEAVRNRLKTFPLDDVVVATAKQVRRDDIEKYAHLGLRIENGILVIPGTFIPPASAGKFSSYNIFGKDVKRTDLPKIHKDFSFYAPSWNSSGFHLVTTTREVYQRDFIPPKEVELTIALLRETDDAFQLKFAINQAVARDAPDFEADILYNLNILQENVGDASVFASDANLADYLETVRVDWELLPAGEADARERAFKVLSAKRRLDPEQEATFRERVAVFEKMKPTHYVAGTSGFTRYFGAMYDDSFVAFENLRYGNALYVMFDDWQTLSKRSRIELLKGNREGFERIEHTDGWEDRFAALLERHKVEQRKQKRGS